MSSRALRKAQREKEEQDRLEQLGREARELEDAQDNAEEEPVVASRPSAFAMLEDNDEDEDDVEVDEPQETEHEPPSTATPSKAVAKKKKKKKKKKAKDGDSVAAHNAEDMDEIDAALKQLSTNGRSSQPATTAAGVDPVAEETCRLLAVDTSHLHAANEMRRLFGRTALENDPDEQPEHAPAGGNRRQQRRLQQVGLAQALRGHQQGGRSGLASIALRRNIFIQGKEEWPAATGGGLGMEVEDKRADGTVLYRYVHSAGYQDVQSQFETAVESMDPERLVVMLQHNPYHISTLLQVSEIAKQDRDNSASGELLERALFSFGRAVHSTFAKNLAEGKARLDFRRAENREFWLASWRYIQNLTLRATWRTVYEWAKLLLSLSPDDDPYAVWMVLDQYAYRSRQDLDYLNLSRNAKFKDVHRNMPNVQITQALCEHRAGSQSKGQQALFAAIGKYPFIIARLFQELNLDAPPAVWAKEPRTDKEKLYAELYATRAKDLWNTPEISNFLVEIASAVPPDTPEAPIDSSDITQAQARHIILSDNPALIALIPRKYTEQYTSASDPVPPDDAFMSYLSRREANRAARDPADVAFGENHGFLRFLEDILPRLQQRGGAAADDNHNAAPFEAREEEFIQGLDNDEGIIRQLQNAGVSPDELRRHMVRFRSLRNGGTMQAARAVSDEEALHGDGGRQARVEDANEADE